MSVTAGGVSKHVKNMIVVIIHWVCKRLEAKPSDSNIPSVLSLFANALRNSYIHSPTLYISAFLHNLDFYVA